MENKFVVVAVVVVVVRLVNQTEPLPAATGRSIQWRGSSRGREECLGFVHVHFYANFDV